MDSDRGYEWQNGDLVLYLKVSAGASADEMTGETMSAAEGGGHACLRIKVAAPPVDGKANKRLRKYLAGRFGVSNSRVVIEKGETRPFKKVCIERPQALPDFISP